jgi:hypothetical protein
MTMVSTFLAAVAALIAALFTLASSVAPPLQESREPLSAPSIDERIDDVRDSMESLVRAATPELPTATLAPQTESLPPESPPVPAAESSDEDGSGCETSKASGEGWARTIVTCISQAANGSFSSVRMSSHSSVNVRATSSNDAP